MRVMSRRTSGKRSGVRRGMWWMMTVWKARAMARKSAAPAAVEHSSANSNDATPAAVCFTCIPGPTRQLLSVTSDTVRDRFASIPGQTRQLRQASRDTGATHVQDARCAHAARRVTLILRPCVTSVIVRGATPCASFLNHLSKLSSASRSAAPSSFVTMYIERSVVISRRKSTF